jgi:hypothetical protein
MNGNEILTLGLGLEPPWKITGQLLDTKKTPNAGDARNPDF